MADCGLPQLLIGQAIIPVIGCIRIGVIERPELVIGKCLIRSYIALLSFSNVAVNTFKRDFLRHTSNQTNKHVYSDRVVIETLDSFIVGNVIRPHGSRVMGCSGVPFLLSGGELFLKNRNFNFEIETQTGRKTIGSDKVVELTCRVVDSSVECFLNKLSLIHI